MNSMNLIHLSKALYEVEHYIFRRDAWQSALTLQIVSFEELLISQVVQQEALTRLLVKKGIFTVEEFLEMVKAVNLEMKRKGAT